MKISNTEQNTDEWLEERHGKIMGSIAADVIPREPLKSEMEKALKSRGMEYIQVEEGVPLTAELLRKILPLEDRLELGRKENRKIGFYQLIADQLGIPPDDEDRMDRGHRLEDEARNKLAEHLGVKLHTVGICSRDDEPRIANSPDALGKKGGKWKIAGEIKCLKSALHIQAVIENKVPDEYWSQGMQYFVVNDELEVLYFAFYDPRVPSKPFHVIEIHREDVADVVERLLAYQRDTLVQVDKLVEELSF